MDDILQERRDLTLTLTLTLVVVEEILQERRAADGTPEFLVKWQGWKVECDLFMACTFMTCTFMTCTFMTCTLTRSRMIVLVAYYSKCRVDPS